MCEKEEREREERERINKYKNMETSEIIKRSLDVKLQLHLTLSV